MKIEYVALTIGGHYLQLVDGAGLLGEQRRLYATGVGVGPDSIFRRHELPVRQQGSTPVALMTHDGHYLEVPPGQGYVGVGATEIGPDQTFEETWLPDDRIVLRTSSEHYVTAENAGGGKVSTNRSAVGAWEKFYYEVVPEGLLPAEFRTPAAPRLGQPRTRATDEVDRAPRLGRPRVGLPTPSQEISDTRRPPRLPGT